MNYDIIYSESVGGEYLIRIIGTTAEATLEDAQQAAEAEAGANGISSPPVAKSRLEENQYAFWFDHSS